VPFKVVVRPTLLRWARERAGLEREDLAAKLGLSLARVQLWERTGELTFGHLQRLADKTHTPVGYLFLPAPPDTPLPVADFRTVSEGRAAMPSPNLLDTVYLCEQRQAWFRELAVEEGAEPLSFVGSARGATSPARVAENVRSQIGLAVDERAAFASWDEALRDLIEKIEAAGILVMRNGVVGNNTHRRLSVTEFRGFALSDAYAPLVFVNAADSKSAQMFTLAHELIHIWRGESGVSDANPHSRVAAETFCNIAAAELLIPSASFVGEWRRAARVNDEVERVARRFKVSTLVVLIRARASNVIDAETFTRLYNAEVARAGERSGEPSGGDFYRTQRSRLGERFAAAVVSSALEGRTPYTEAFQLLGVRKGSTFDELARTLGVML
jgi:Zn-dependent peptidase ImmA (M78 family)/transcriptional regulator with XRE-family HTH domain